MNGLTDEQIAYLEEHLQVRFSKMTAAGQADAAAPTQDIDDAAVRTAELLEEARYQADSYRNSMTAMRAEQQSVFGAKLPKELAAAMDEIDVLLKTEGLDDPAKIDAAVDAAGDKMPAMEALANSLKSDLTDYQRALSRVEARVAALKAHDQNAATLIAKLIKGVEGKLAEAVVKGTAREFVDAGSLLDETLELCATAEVSANNVGQYEAVVADRRTRVANLPDPAAITDAATKADVSTQIEAIKKLLTDSEAEAAKENGDFGKATALLADIPKEVIRVKQLVKDAIAYSKKHEDLDKRITAAETWASKVPQVATHMVGIKAVFQAANYAATNSFRKSVDLLDRGDSKVDELRKIVNKYADAEKTALDLKAKFKELQDHLAGDGILQEITDIRADWEAAVLQLNAGGYAGSEALFKHALSKYEPAKKKADECHEYREELKKSKGKIDTYDDSSYPDSITIQVEACKFWIGEAEGKAASRDYVTAKEKATRATIYYDLAKSAYDGAAWATNNLPELDDIDKNWPGLWGQYQTLKGGITGRDGNDFVTVKPHIDNAEAAAGTAEAAATAAKPDWPTAKTDLQTAIDRMYDAQLELDKLDAYKALLGQASARYSALVDEDGQFTAYKEIIRGLIEVDAKAASEAGDWNNAEINLDKALNSCEVMEKDCAAYKAYKPIRDPAVKDLLLKLDQNNPKIFMKTEVPKFISDVAAADGLLTPGNFPEALKKLKEANRVGDILSAKCDIAMQAWLHDRDWIKHASRLPAIENEALVSDLVQAILPQITEMRKKFTDRHFQEALDMVSRINSDINYAKMFVDDHKAYELELTRAKAAQTGMTDVTCDAIAQDIKSVAAHLAAAGEFAKERVFKSAMSSLAKVGPIAVAAKAIGEAFALFAPVEADAKAKLETLAKEFVRIEPVELQIEHQKALMAKTGPLVAARDFVAAKKVVDEVVAACAEIRSAGSAQAGVDTMSSEIGGRSDADAEQIALDIAAVQEELTRLDGHAAKEAIQSQRARIKRLLDDATAAKDKAEPDLKAALNAVKDAASQCQTARSDAESFAGVENAVTRATKRMGEIEAAYTVPKFTLDKLASAKGNLGRCTADIKTGVYSSAMNGLLSAQADLDEAERVGKLHAIYLAMRGPLDTRLTALAGHKARYAVAKEIKAIGGLFSGADGSVAAQDYDSVMDLMANAKKEIDKAELTADMHSNKKIEKEDLEKVLSHPGGEAVLDKIIEGLDPSAKRKACKLALEVRFDLSFTEYTDDDGTTENTDEDAQGPNIVRLYKTMGMVPESHTKGNPSVNKVKKFGEDVGTSSFNKWTRDKEIELRIGRGDEDHSRAINQEYQLGEVLDTCKPVDDIPPPKFSWTTLHEIGHAVDDKKSWMKKNGKAPSNGGWKEYGSDVGDIAKAAASKFTYSAKYLEAYLSKSKMDPPPPEGGVTQAEWDRARILAEAWCDSIRKDAKIWYSASASENAMIDFNGEKRVYQESYTNKWVSYLFEKRKEGVAGYQFRAPGEWFAELYAAYHTKKMNPSHPAASWLKDL